MEGRDASRRQLNIGWAVLRGLWKEEKKEVEEEGEEEEPAHRQGTLGNLYPGDMLDYDAQGFL